MSKILQDGASCAASVFYAGDKKKRQWIVGKIEKRQVNGKFVVRDEDADSRKYLRYIVDPERILPFPPRNNVYHVNEAILALWMNSPDDWSTVFYPAKVTEIINEHEIRIAYDEGSDEEIVIDISKCTKLNDTEIEEEKEVKEEETKPEPIKSLGFINLGSKPLPTKTLSSKNLGPKQNNIFFNFIKPPETPNPPKNQFSKMKRSHSCVLFTNIEINDDDDSDQDIRHMGGSLSRTVSIDDFNSLSSNESTYNEFQRLIEKENQGSTKWGKIVKSDHNLQSIPKPEIVKTELRKAKFVFNIPTFPETPDLPILEDDEFLKNAGQTDRCHIERPPIQYNQDLLKYLDNPLLFPKTMSHITASGRIHLEVNNVDNNNDNQSVMKFVSPDTKITCGRLGKMFSYLNQSSK